MDDRAFVGCDGVHAVSDSRSEMVDRWLPGLVIDRGIFKHDIAAAAFDKFIIVMDWPCG
jgi:hypothetical protein